MRGGEDLIREVGTEVYVTKIVKVKEIGVKEAIVSINHLPSENTIRLGIYLYNSADEVIRDDNLSINGGNYDLLMSDSDVFVSGKTKGVYRDSDLWYIIDKIRRDELLA